ncbi:MAG: 16S rRNA (guanine(527)-N(7))-methyltransferase RsmG [Deltaproteobacteria bacterium]|nr:16S rRNA (guanine(527)-N(7))-methyltransferase RsmG [Deltaproteobacteria bacterium]
MSEALRSAIADLELEDPDRVVGLLAAHWALVKTWNERVNLTSILDDGEAAWLHYRDSLEALRVLVPGEVVDLGSGAGYPGIPLAIAEPGRRVTLVEPRRKRASFLETVAARLGLSNVVVVVGRSDDEPAVRAANVVTRATFSGVAELTACKKWLAPHGAPHGQLIAYRSAASGDPASRVHRYGLRGEQRILEIWTSVS